MGIVVRSGPLSHPEVQQLIADHFVPVNFDVRRVFPFAVDSPGTPIPPATNPQRAASKTEIEEDPELEFFLSIHRQDPMSQGIWFATPSGKVLGTSYQVAAQPMIGLIQKVLADWLELDGRPPLPLPASAERVARVPVANDSTVRLLIHGRLSEGFGSEPFRDYAELSREEWTRLLPDPPEVGASMSVPRTILENIATRFYPGEMRHAIDRNELQQAAMTVTVREVASGVVRADLSGSIEISGVTGFGGARQRRYEALLSGEIRWQRDSRAPVALELLSDGMWQAEYPEGMPPGAFDLYPNMVGRLVMSPAMRMLFLVELSDAGPDHDRSEVQRDDSEARLAQPG